MIVPALTPADPHPLDPVVSFYIDADAEPGNVLPILAALLIGIDRRRRERQAMEQAGAQDAQGEQGGQADAD